MTPEATRRKFVTAINLLIPPARAAARGEWKPGPVERALLHVAKRLVDDAKDQR